MKGAVVRPEISLCSRQGTACKTMQFWREIPNKDSQDIGSRHFVKENGKDNEQGPLKNHIISECVIHYSPSKLLIYFMNFKKLIEIKAGAIIIKKL